MTDSVVGMIAAAPTPMSARSAISRPGSSVTMPNAAAVPKTASPTSSRPLRPKRSPSAPANRSRPAKTTV